MHRTSAALAALVLILPTGAAAAPDCAPGGRLRLDGLGTPAEEQARLADLAEDVLVPSSGILRRGGVTSRDMCQGASMPWGDRYVEGDAPAAFAWLAPRLAVAYERSSPAGGNDGLLWQGKGTSSFLTAGARGRWGPFSYQLAPEIAWAENADFELVDNGLRGRRRFASGYYATGLDVPQRFGESPVLRAAFGQSYLQLEGYGAKLGLSTENRWWGPGIRHAVLLTSNAPGFPHVYLGTARPVDIGVGAIEVEWLLGALTKTEYHNDPSAHPAFTGFAFVYQPRWVRGLHLGAGRTYIESWDSLRDDWFLSAFEGLTKSSAGGDNPNDNQMLSAWFRWILRDVEFYGEYGQDDFPTFNSFLRQPDRCAIWNLGVQKRIVAGPRWWRVIAELSKSASNLQGEFACSVYLHRPNGDYSHEGQLLGDWIGPGADSQYLAVDVFTKGGRFGGYFERVRRHREVFWRLRPTGEVTGNDVEVVLGLRQVLLLRTAEVSWNVAAGQHFNRDFLGDEFVLRAGLTVTPALWGEAARRDE